MQVATLVALGLLEVTERGDCEAARRHHDGTCQQERNSGNSVMMRKRPQGQTGSTDQGALSTGLPHPHLASPLESTHLLLFGPASFHGGLAPSH